MLYVLKKIGYLLISLWIVITLTFFLMKIVPGDPFSDEQGLPKEIHDALLAHYGLDRPLFEQYLIYVKSILHGDFGLSLKYSDHTVNDIILEYFPTSALLGAEAVLFAIAIGVLLGSLSAIKKNQWQDYTIVAISILGISIPSFVFATLLRYLLAYKLDLLPLARWGTFSHTILPTLALAALPIAYITRMIRSNMIEVLNSDYIKTAKAKGLNTKTIIVRHALKNAFLPILSYLGQLIANILVGSFIIEKIFSIPGLGRWFVNSINNRDYPVIMGLTIFYSLFLMCSVLLIDLAYHRLDPRIKLNRG